MHKIVISAALADAEDLLQQSLGHFDPDKLFLNSKTKSPNVMANYVGPVHVTHISSTFTIQVCSQCRPRLRDAATN